MNLSQPFVRRPIGTVLLTAGVALAGIGGFFVLPVSPLPQVDFPTISVSAQLPGASPDTMATSVATPLERRLGTIAGITEMTSSSQVGSARVSLQFELSKNIDSAAREVQAAINASRVDLPATLRSNPTYRKANPSDAPIIILALTSATLSPGQIYDTVSNIVSQRLAQVDGVGDVEIGGSTLPAVRVELLPFALNKYGISGDDVRAAIQASNANRPKGQIEGEGRRLQIYTQTPARRAADYAPMVVAWRNGAAVRLDDVAEVSDGVENTRTLGLFNGKPAVIVLVTRQPGANVIKTVDGVRALLPELRAQLPAEIALDVASDSTNSIRASLREIELTLRDLDRARRRRRQRLPAQLARDDRAGGGDGGLAARHLRRDVPARLLAQQPEPDGAHRRHRLRRRRRDRRAREHGAPHRGRHGPDEGGAARRAGGRLHGALDQRLAGRGVHPAALHAGPGRAAVPRVRDHALGGGDDLARHLADDDADAVRLAARPGRRGQGQQARPARSLGRAPASPRCCRGTRRASTGRSPASGSCSSSSPA